jgi:putative transposase
MSRRAAKPLPKVAITMRRALMMMCVKYPLSLRNVDDLLAERGIDISHETVRFWWNRFGPMFAAEIRKKRVALQLLYLN